MKNIHPQPPESAPALPEVVSDRDALVHALLGAAAARLRRRVLAGIASTGGALVVEARPDGSAPAARPDLRLPMQALTARFRHAPVGRLDAEARSRVPPELLEGASNEVALAPIDEAGEVRGTLLTAGDELGDDEVEALGDTGRALGLALAAAQAVDGDATLTEAGALQAMAEALAGSTVLGRVLSAAVRNGARATGFQRCSVLLRNGSAGLVPAASATEAGPAPLAGWRMFSEGLGLPAANEAMAAGSPMAFESPADEPRLVPARWVGPQRIARVLLAPMVAWEEPVGVMVFDDTTAGPIASRDVRIAEALARQAAVSVKVANLIEGLQHSQRHAQLVMGTMAHAAAQLNTEGVLAVIAGAVSEVLGDAATIVFAVEGGVLGRFAVHGNETQGRDVAVRIAAGEALRDEWDGPTALYGEQVDRIGALESEDVGRVLVVPLRRASRQLGWLVSFSSSSRAYRDGDLRIVGALATQATLSLHTVRLLEGERSSVAQLEEQGKQKTGFVASVSHELRTPLTAIIGFSEILNEWLEDDRMRQFIEDVRREAVVLEGIIGNLLDTSRLDAGVLFLDRVPVDVATLVRDAIEVVGHTYSTRHFEASLPERLAPVPADPVRLRQILVNLIENAAKYSAESSTITVDVSVESGELVITVTDEGPGIPVAYRDRVFDRFFRLEGMHGKPGTGIGLYLVRELTEAHGGSVSIREGPEGRGCAVEVRIPAPT